MTDYPTDRINKSASKKYSNRRTKENPNLFVGARNLESADFYRLVVEPRRDSTPLPTPESKKHYIECLKAAIVEYPVEVLAYSVLDKKVFLIIATYDQTAVSHTRWIQGANTNYMLYRNKYFKGAGNVFKNKIKSKKIESLSDLIDSIVIVHSQPYANGLSTDYSYDFSSYQENPAFNLVNLNSLFLAVKSYEEGERLLAEAHEKSPKFLPSDFISIPTVEGFNTVLEEILYDYKIYDKKAIPGELMYRIVTELNERGGYTIDYIISKIKLDYHDKYELILEVIVDLALTFSQTYDESIKNLDITFSSREKARETLRDVVVMISNRTNYAYDYIMNLLGLAYPNYEFLKELIRYISDMQGLSYVNTMKKLGIRENLPYVLNLVTSD